MSNLVKALTPLHLHDIAPIRAIHPILLKLTDMEIQIVWEAFSSDLCSGYLLVNDHTLKDFLTWLQE